MLGLWLLRVLMWDGLLPAGVVLVPTFVEFRFPNNRGAIELTALALPSVGLLIRLWIGRRFIAANHCTVSVRKLQFCALFLGIFLLAFLEGVLILTHVMPSGALFVHQTDVVIFAMLFSTYLLLMSIAMYPGQADSPQEVT